VHVPPRLLTIRWTVTPWGAVHATRLIVTGAGVEFWMSRIQFVPPSERSVSIASAATGSMLAAVAAGAASATNALATMKIRAVICVSFLPVDRGRYRLRSSGEEHPVGR
jgi:hypothetical protein